MVIELLIANKIKKKKYTGGSSHFSSNYQDLTVHISPLKL